MKARGNLQYAMCGLPVIFSGNERAESTDTSDFPAKRAGYRQLIRSRNDVICAV